MLKAKVTMSRENAEVPEKIVVSQLFIRGRQIPDMEEVPVFYQRKRVGYANVSEDTIEAELEVEDQNAPVLDEQVWCVSTHKRYISIGENTEGKQVSIDGDLLIVE